MKKMLDWLTHLLWISEGFFLAASTPHIATYFAHFDNPTDFWGTIYAWGVGYGLALTIDGVSIVRDRKSTRLNSSHLVISYAVFCLKKKNKHTRNSVMIS